MERTILRLTEDRSRAIEMVSQAPDGHVVEIRKPSRSLEQNALYWAAVHEVAESVWLDCKQFTPQVWHRYFKERFLPGRVIEMPFGLVTEAEPSTTELTVDEFSHFIDQVIYFKDQHL